MYEDRKITNPLFKIYINNKLLAEEYKRYITEVSIDEADNEPTMGTIVIEDIDKVFLNNNYLKKDTPVKIELGHYENSKKITLDGKIAIVEGDYTETGTPIMTITVLDKFKDMGKTKKTRTWKNKTKAQVVTSIAQSYGLKAKINAGKLEAETITQSNETDLDLIQRLAHEEDYAFYISGNTLYWGFKELNKSPSKTYYYNTNTKDIINFRVSYVEKFKEEQVSTKSTISTTSQKTVKASSSSSSKKSSSGSKSSKSSKSSSSSSKSKSSSSKSGYYVYYDSKGNTKVVSAQERQRSVAHGRRTE